MNKIVVLMVLMTQLISCQPAWAESINVERLADAIYKAEGNDNYGILKNIKGHDFRKACIQTITHGLRDWNGNGNFIDFLSTRYAPIEASNDPQGLNHNWIKNVNHFYKKKISK